MRRHRSAGVPGLVAGNAGLPRPAKLVPPPTPTDDVSPRKSRFNFGYLPTLAEVQAQRVDLTKPSRTARQKVEEKAERAHAAARDRFRAHIFELDHGKCRRCQKALYIKVKDAPHELLVANVHEFVLKAQGGDDLDELNCLLLCADCHLWAVHGKRFDIVPRDAKRLMRGKVGFLAHVDKPPVRKSQ